MIRGNTSERMFRLYARLATEAADRRRAELERDHLAKQLEQAVDREAAIVSLYGHDGPGAA